MDDSKGRERAKKFYEVGFGDYREKQEQFQVSLRKKKRKELFERNRKVMVRDDIHMDDESLFITDAEICKLPNTEKVEALVHRIVTGSDPTEVNKILDYLPVIIRDDWNDKYINVLATQKFITKLCELLKNSTLRMTINITKLLINLNFHIEPGMVDNFMNREFIQTLFEHLQIAEDSQAVLVEKYSKVLVLLANLSFNFPEICQMLLDDGVLGVVEGLLNTQIPSPLSHSKTLYSDVIFRGSVVSLVDSILASKVEISKEDILPFEELILENIYAWGQEWEGKDLEYRINYTEALTRIYVRFPDLFTKTSVVDCLLQFLENFKKLNYEIVNSCLRLVSNMALLDENKLIFYAFQHNLVEIFQKIYSKPEPNWKLLILQILGCYCEEKEEDIFQVSTKKLYLAICADTRHQNPVVARQAIATLNK